MFDTFKGSLPLLWSKVYYSSTADSNGYGNEFVMCMLNFAIFFLHTKLAGVLSRFILLPLLHTMRLNDKEWEYTHWLLQILITRKSKQWKKLLCFFFFSSALPLSSMFSPLSTLLHGSELHKMKVKCHTFIINYFFFIPRHGNFAF